MHRLLVIARICAAVALLQCCVGWAGVVIVGHPSLRKLDLQTVQRIYTGKVVEVDGIRVQPINAPAGQALRQRFLTEYLQQTEDSYVAYWTVRRYVGKGTPPRELMPVAEVLNQIANIPGAIAYVDETELTPGVSVLLRR